MWECVFPFSGTDISLAFSMALFFLAKGKQSQLLVLPLYLELLLFLTGLRAPS